MRMTIRNQLRIAPGLILLLIAAASVADEAVPAIKPEEIPKPFQEIFAAEDQFRDREMRRLRDEFLLKVKSTKSADRPDLENLYKAKVDSAGQINPQARKLSYPLKNGNVGYCNLNAKVLQVIDEETHLAVVGEFIYMVKGFPTNDLADDEKKPIRGLVFVSGTESYTTTAGAKKTVRVVERLDEKTLADYRKIWRTENPIADVEITTPDGLPEIEDKPAKPETPKKPVDPELAAAEKLKQAKALNGVNDAAYKRRLKDVVEAYPKTVAAKEAAKLLAK